jgi:hypothetical protein
MQIYPFFLLVFGQNAKRGATHAPLIPLSSSLFIKQIDFKEQVVSGVTAETTFSLKSIYLMKREDEWMFF